MKNQIETTNKKRNKIYAVLTSIVIIFIIVNVFGVDFFQFDFIYDAEKYNININQLDELTKMLIVINIKAIIAIFFLLRLKHGELYKNIIIGMTTLMSICVFINIFTRCSSVGNMFSALIIYLPNYINVYVYIILFEKAEPFIEQYNECKKIQEEVKPLVKIMVLITGISIIISFCHALTAIMII